MDTDGCLHGCLDGCLLRNWSLAATAAGSLCRHQLDARLCVLLLGPKRQSGRAAEFRCWPLPFTSAEVKTGLLTHTCGIAPLVFLTFGSLSFHLRVTTVSNELATYCPPLFLESVHCLLYFPPQAPLLVPSSHLSIATSALHSALHSPWSPVQFTLSMGL